EQRPKIVPGEHADDVTAEVRGEAAQRAPSVASELRVQASRGRERGSLLAFRGRRGGGGGGAGAAPARAGGGGGEGGAGVTTTGPPSSWAGGIACSPLSGAGGVEGEA